MTPKYSVGALISALIFVANVFSYPANALTFQFSFTNTVGGVSGTVTGEIQGLTEGVSFATAVIITGYPSALQVGVSAPFDALASDPVNASNKYVVTSGVLTFISNQYDGANWRLLLSGPGGLNDLRTVSPSEAVASNDITVVAVAETPLPAALPLFASGAGVLGFLGWRMKKKAAALAA